MPPYTFWSVNLMVVNCTITDILMTCRKTFKKKQEQQQLISACKLSLFFYSFIYVMQDSRALVQA